MNIGPNASPSVSYLNDDTLPDLILGNERGGVSLFLGTLENPISINEIEIKQLHLFPNPCRDFLKIGNLSSFEFKMKEVVNRQGVEATEKGKERQNNKKCKRKKNKSKQN